MIPKRKGAIFKSDTLCDENNDCSNDGDKLEQSDKLEQIENKVDDELSGDKVSENSEAEQLNDVDKIKDTEKVSGNAVKSDRIETSGSKVDNTDHSTEGGFHEQCKGKQSSSTCDKVTSDHAGSSG